MFPTRRADLFRRDRHSGPITMSPTLASYEEASCRPKCPGQRQTKGDMWVYHVSHTLPTASYFDLKK
jgi:hypothetical protein